MADQSQWGSPYNALARTLAAFRSQGRMDMAFGGKVHPGGKSFAITELCGARTTSLANLVVRHGDGLGGKALQLGRPVSVARYHQAQGITHVYDHAVGRERLETVVALPVVVDSRPKLMVYLGSRSQVALGDRWFESFVPLIRRLERAIAIDDEVRRRLQTAGQAGEEGLSWTELGDMASELADLANQIEDETLKARLEGLCGRLVPPPSSRTSPSVRLALREIDVLTQVAAGYTNRQAAENLGLLPNTVKSYLRTAMRKLGVSNRVQAITAARRSGQIR